MIGKVESYTVSELLVVLIISGLVMTFIYQSFLTVNKFRATLTEKVEKTQGFERLYWLINRDFEESEFLYKSGNKIACIKDGRQIVYDFSYQFPVRIQEELSESFPFEITSVDFDLIEKSNQPLVKRLTLTLLFEESDLRLQVCKHYDAVSRIQ